MMKRREFVQTTGASALALFVSGCVKRQTNGRTTASDTGSQRRKESAGAGGFGPLITAKDGLLDLPEGFTYCIVQTAGDALSDGYQMPQQPDGMACFEGPKGEYVCCETMNSVIARSWAKETTSMRHFSGEIVPSPHYAKGCLWRRDSRGHRSLCVADRTPAGIRTKIEGRKAFKLCVGRDRTQLRGWRDSARLGDV